MSFCIIRRLGDVLARVLTELMARRVEIGPLVAVLLAVWRAGAPIMEANGKSRSKGDSFAALRSEWQRLLPGDAEPHLQDPMLGTASGRRATINSFVSRAWIRAVVTIRTFN